MNDLDQLNNRFSIPGVACVEAGEGGLPRLAITSALAEAEIYLHGAHVTRFAERGKAPVLFLSAKSHFAADKPIRGGVPICFPWFGPKAGDSTAPMHGFARLMSWSLAEATLLPDGSVRVAMELKSSDATSRLWPIEFLARYQVTIGEHLELALRVTNNSPAAITFEEALHTYLAVGDVKAASIDGLDARRYIDKVDGAKQKIQTGAIVIRGETDRVYLDTTDAVTINDPALSRKVLVRKSGSSTTVVWNPWIAKAKAMADFGDAEWPGMLCVETANAASDVVSLAPGATHEMKARIETVM